MQIYALQTFDIFLVVLLNLFQTNLTVNLINQKKKKNKTVVKN